MKALILAGFLLSTVTGFAQDVHFLVAVKEDQNPRTANTGWRVEVGEVYQFVRGMSASEYTGGPSQADNTYVVLKLDDVQVVSPTANFRPVEDKDMVQAAMKYNQEVVQNRQDEKETQPSGSTQQAQEQQGAHPAVGRGWHRAFSDRRVEARYEQIAQDLIAKGIDPTETAVMAVLQPELDAQDAKAATDARIGRLESETQQLRLQQDNR
jgi:hypothetical protein